MTNFALMNKTISKYISELLFLHDCVIIPQFGGFIGNNKSAILNETTGIISPPSKEILFNPNLKTNDGLLINHISNSEGISNIEARDLVINYVSLINDKLKKIRTFRIKNVGLLSLGTDDNILFLQDSFTNYNLESFGLNSQKTKKVNHIEKKIEVITAPISTKKGRAKIWRAAAILLPIIGLSLVSITQEEKIEKVYANMSSFKLFSISEKIPILEKNKEEIFEITITTEETKNTSVAEHPKIIEKKFYLVAGAFNNERNANNLMNKLQSENFNSEIIGTNKNGLIRVSYDSFISKEEALIALEKLKLKNKSSWILSL
ncbi:MAG: hypothetical protein CMD02_02840 [Flavobacteriales bacterium]|nr:hypothetical protein [Flavobacteriales bacterium]